MMYILVVLDLIVKLNYVYLQCSDCNSVNIFKFVWSYTIRYWNKKCNHFIENRKQI